MWKRVNIPTCECCTYVLSCEVARDEKDERVVNVPIYCGWSVVYMSVSVSLCPHALLRVRDIARINLCSSHL